MATYSVFILLAYFSPKSQGKRKSAMFSTKKNMESNNLLAGDGKRVLVRKNETPPYCKSSLCCVISVSDSSVHFAAEFLHCSVKSELSLQPWDSPCIETPTAEDWAYVKRCSLRLCFLIQNYFLFHCINHETRENGSFSLVIKWSREGARDADSAIRRYRYAFKTISWNTETPRNLTSFV